MAKNAFHGEIDELKAAVQATGLRGEWSEDADGGKHSFKTQTGGVMNWWSSKGTLQFQGKSTAKDDLEAKVVEQLNNPDNNTQEFYQTPAKADATQGIFVVHGHDSDARDQLELVLRRLNLEPFILMNTTGGGKTIIEALEGQIGRDYSSAFGIVLMTPDDMGYAIAHGEEKIEPRARQNVILEIGMLLSSLTRERMALIVKGHVEIPSDIDGIIRFHYNEHIREIVPKLCKRLGEAGIALNPDLISEASA